jgi:GR25 family glycosyltransferase involved in LPS biosynthesis
MTIANNNGTHLIPFVCAFILGVERAFRGTELFAQVLKVIPNTSLHFGIDAKDERDFLSSRVSQFKSFLNHGRKLTLGEVACFIGHHEIYREFLNTPSQWCLVLEDDAVIRDLPTDLIHELIQVDSPIIVNLFSENYYTQKNLAKTIYTNDRKTLTFTKFLKPGTMCIGYLINRNAAEIALSRMTGRKVTSTSDWPMRWKYKVEFYQSCTTMIDSDELTSLIEDSGERVIKVPSVLRLVVRIFRLSGIPSLLAGISNENAIDHYRDLVIFPIRLRFNSIWNHYEKVLPDYRKAVFLK